MTRIHSSATRGLVGSAGIAAALVAAPPAFAQQLGGARPLDIPFVQIFAGLILCSLAAFAAALVLRQRRGGTPVFKAGLPWLARGAATMRPLKVLESHRLSPHADLCRFIAHDREYVVVVTAGAITIVADRPSSTDTSPQPTAKGSA